MRNNNKDESLNGMITVRSEPGRGSSFNVYLPVIEHDAAGVIAYPLKPISGNLLLTQIAKALEKGHEK